MVYIKEDKVKGCIQHTKTAHAIASPAIVVLSLLHTVASKDNFCVPMSTQGFITVTPANEKGLRLYNTRCKLKTEDL